MAMISILSRSVQNRAVWSWALSEAKLKQLEVDYDIDEVLEGVTGSIGEARKSTYGLSAVTAAELLLQRISSVQGAADDEAEEEDRWVPPTPGFLR